MRWKDLSYWIRGGLIGLLFSILAFSIFIFLPVKCVGLSENGTACQPLQGFEAITFNFIIILNAQDKLLLMFYFILPIIFGALIGWLCGKIKGMKRKRV